MQNKVLKHKKNINLNQHIISFLSGNPAECKSLLNIMPLDSRVKPENDREVGRSMVEMLGVLAVMGVLSVGGVAMYTNAMNKHKANELLNEASKRAAIVAMQFASGRSEGSLAEFTNNSVAGAEFATTVTVPTANTNQFTVSFVSGKAPSEAICNQMKTAVGANTIIRNIATNCGTITFNKDLSTTDSAPAQIICEESEMVRKTYYIGACCDVAIEGKFCPSEEVPTCTKMNEAACACTTESCCAEAEGEWKKYDPYPTSYSICIPTGSKSYCTSYNCAICKPTETLKYAYSCNCGLGNESMASAMNGIVTSCGKNLKPVCTSTSCTCEDL